MITPQGPESGDVVSFLGCDGLFEGMKWARTNVRGKEVTNVASSLYMMLFAFGCVPSEMRVSICLTHENRCEKGCSYGRKARGKLQLGLVFC